MYTERGMCRNSYHYCVICTSHKGKDWLSARGWKKHLRDSESLARRSCARGKCQDRLTCLNTGTKSPTAWLGFGNISWVLGWCYVMASKHFLFLHFSLYSRSSNTFAAAKLRLTNIVLNFFIGQSPNTFFTDTVACIWQAIHFKNTYFISWCSAIRKSNYFWQHTPKRYLIRHSSPG